MNQAEMEAKLVEMDRNMMLMASQMTLMQQHIAELQIAAMPNTKTPFGDVE